MSKMGCSNILKFEVGAIFSKKALATEEVVTYL